MKERKFSLYRNIALLYFKLFGVLFPKVIRVW